MSLGGADYETKSADSRRELQLAAGLLAGLASSGRAMSAPTRPSTVRSQAPAIHLIYGLVLVSLLSASGVPAAASPRVAGCPVLPDDNIWNQPVDTLPVDPASASYIQTIGATTGLHPDFGTLWQGAPIGIPYVDVPGNQPPVEVLFQYASESDPGPYPIPPDAPIEGGPGSSGDRHVLVLDRDRCVLYELFDAWPQPDDSWVAGSGAIFDLNSNRLRPDGWTSADAAGLPILPGLVRYEEVAAGEIRHALRFTAPQTRQAYVWPARYYASNLTGSQYPPMGQRFRLRANFDLSGFSPQVKVILQALKTYGMILADNGSAWYISGVPNALWDDDALVSELRLVKGADFEAVDVSALMVDMDSGGISDPVVDGCPAGDPASVEIVTYPDGSVIDCQKTVSISAGPGVLVASGAQVTYRAPNVFLQAGFRVIGGGAFSAAGP